MPTENNAVYSNALSELPALPDTLIVSEESIAVPASPDEENMVSVTSNRAWTLSADQAWITLSENSGLRNGEFLVAVSPNTGSAPRTGTITVTAGAKIRIIGITQDGVTGMNETAGSLPGLSIFPNPSNGSFTVDLTGSDAIIKTISIYDIAGKLLKNIPVETGNKFLKLALDYSAGIYFMHLNTDKGAAAQKIIIQ
ncbi:MAG: T9SS type A sorting domain-containing protein [Bacteroidota bacterium]